jgi:hypothetical protein
MQFVGDLRECRSEILTCAKFDVAATGLFRSFRQPGIGPVRHQRRLQTTGTETRHLLSPATPHADPIHHHAKLTGASRLLRREWTAHAPQPGVGTGLRHDRQGLEQDVDPLARNRAANVQQIGAATFSRETGGSSIRIAPRLRAAVWVDPDRHDLRPRLRHQSTGDQLGSCRLAVAHHTSGPSEAASDPVHQPSRQSGRARAGGWNARMAPRHHHYELEGWKENQVVVRFWIITMMLVLFGLSTLKLR